MAGMNGFSVLWEEDGQIFMSPVYESKSKLKREFMFFDQVMRKGGGRIVEHNPKNPLKVNAVLHVDYGENGDEKMTIEGV